MTENQRKMMEMLGLTEDDLKADEVTEKERVSVLEDAFAELCEVIFNG